MTMTNTKPSDRPDADLKKCVLFGVAMIWMLSVVVAVAGLYTPAISGDWLTRLFVTGIAFLVVVITTLLLLILGPTMLTAARRRPSDPRTRDITELRDDWIRHAAGESRAPDPTRHATTDSQTPDGTSARRDAATNLKVATALGVVTIWTLALLFFAASLLAFYITGSPYGRQWATFNAVVVLFLSTPVLLLFAVPTLIKYHPRRTPDRTRHAMPQSQMPDQAKPTAPAAPSFPGFLKGSAIAGAMTWGLSLLALLTAKPHQFGDQLIAFVFLALATLFLLLFVLPASIISFARRH